MANTNPPPPVRRSQRANLEVNENRLTSIIGFVVPLIAERAHVTKFEVISGSFRASMAQFKSVLLAELSFIEQNRSIFVEQYSQKIDWDYFDDHVMSFLTSRDLFSTVVLKLDRKILYTFVAKIQVFCLEHSLMVRFRYQLYKAINFIAPPILGGMRPVLLYQLYNLECERSLKNEKLFRSFVNEYNLNRFIRLHLSYISIRSQKLSSEGLHKPLLDFVNRHVTLAYTKNQRYKNFIDTSLNFSLLPRVQTIKNRERFRKAIYEIRNPMRRTKHNYKAVQSMMDEAAIRCKRDYKYHSKFESQGLFDISPTITHEAGDSMQNIMLECTTAFDNIARNMQGGVNVNVNHSIPILDSLTASVSKLLNIDLAGKEMKLLCSFIIAAMSIYVARTRSVTAGLLLEFVVLYVQTKYSYDSLLMIFLQCIASFNAGVAIGDGMSDWSDRAFEPQMNMSDSNCKAVLKSLLALLTFSAFSKVKWETKNKGFFEPVEAFLKNMHETKKMADGAEFTFSFVIDVVNNFLNYLSKISGMTDLAVSTSAYPELDLIQEELALNLRKLSTSEIVINYQTSLIFFDLDRRIDKLIAIIPNGHEFVSYKRSAIYLKTMIKPVLVKIASANVTKNGPRFEPLGVYLCGGTGVGKSTSSTPLMLDVLSLILDDNEIKSFMSNPNDSINWYDKNDPYMTTYHGQTVFAVDEFGQLRDTPGAVNPEFATFFQAISNNNYNISGAAIEDKGTKNFSSMFCLALSNIENFTAWVKTLVSNDALARRFEVCLRQTVKTEYCTDETMNQDIGHRRLDPVKASLAPRLVPTHAYSMDVYEYYEHNLMTGESHGSPLSYYQAVEFIAKMFLLKKQRNLQYLDFCKDMLTASMSNREKFRSKPENARFLPQMGFTSPDCITRFQTHMMRNLSLFLSMCKCYQHDGLFVIEKVFEYFEKLDNEKQNEMVDKIPILEHTDYMLMVIDFYQSKFIVPVAQQALTMCERITEFVSKNAFLIGAISLVGTIIIIWKLCKDKFEPQSDYPLKSNKVAKSKPRVKPRTFRTAKEEINHFAKQSAFLTKNHLDMIRKLAHRNMYGFRIIGYNVKCGYFTFIYGRVAISPYHYFEKFEELFAEKNDLTIEFWKIIAPEHKYCIKYKDLIHATSDNGYDPEKMESSRDVSYWLFPNGLEQHPSIVKYFPPEDSKLFSMKMHAVVLAPDNVYPAYSLLPVDAIPVSNFRYGDMTILDGFNFNIFNEYGHCGRLLVSSDDRLSQMYILGMWTAGDGRTAFATNLKREEAEDAIQYFKSLTDDCSAYELLEDQYIPSGLEVKSQMGVIDICNDSEDADLLYDVRNYSPQIGVVPDNLALIDAQFPAIVIPTRSKIVKSPLYGSWGPSHYMPAKLKPFEVNGEIIDPWVVARTKLCPSRPALDMEDVTLASNIYNSQLFAKSTKRLEEPRVWTIREAIEGIPGKAKSLNRNGSLCYPWSMHVRAGTGKKELFGSDGPFDFNSPLCLEFIKSIEDDIKTLKSGKRPFWLNTSFLKDERRPIEKVLAGKTRLFNGCPSALVIIGRMYLGDWMTWMEDNKITNGSLVGINPFSDDWKIIGQDLTVSGDNLIDGDAVNFDGSMHPVIQYEARKTPELFYYNATETDKMIRRIIWEDLVHSRHIGVFNEDCKLETDIDWSKVSFKTIQAIYSYIGSMVSGWPGTTTINCVNNQLCITYALIRQLRKHGYTTAQLLVMVKEFVIKVFGDDCVIAVPDKYTQLIDFYALQAGMAEIGIKLTPADKGEIGYTHKKLVEINLLKRGFRWDLEMKEWCCPLVTETIYEMPYWLKKNSPPGTLEDIVQSALKELSFKEQTEEVIQLSSNIQKACLEKLGFVPPVTDRKLLFKLLKSDEYEY